MSTQGVPNKGCRDIPNSAGRVERPCLFGLVGSAGIGSRGVVGRAGAPPCHCERGLPSAAISHHRTEQPSDPRVSSVGRAPRPVIASEAMPSAAISRHRAEQPSDRCVSSVGPAFRPSLRARLAERGNLPPSRGAAIRPLRVVSRAGVPPVIASEACRARQSPALTSAEVRGDRSSLSLRRRVLTARHPSTLLLIYPSTRRLSDAKSP
jgi:hypothetical protein